MRRLVSTAPGDATIELDVPPEPVQVACDGPRIEQVVLNVVSNAIKYSPNEKRVRIAVSSANGCASVSVRDEGAGMTPAQAEKIFEPFERGARVAAHAPGHGLGLYVSRCIVEQHGGAIRVESAPGRGSLFRIELPRSGDARDAVVDSFCART